MPHYSPAMRDRAVELYESGSSLKHTGAQIQQEFHPPYPALGTIKVWIAQSRGKISQGVRGAVYEPELIGVAVAHYLVEGKDANTVGFTVGCNPSTIRRWVKDYGPADAAAAAMSFHQVKVIVMDAVGKHRRHRKTPDPSHNLRYFGAVDPFTTKELPDDVAALKQMLRKERQERVIDQAVIDVLLRRPAPGKE